MTESRRHVRLSRRSLIEGALAGTALVPVVSEQDHLLTAAAQGAPAAGRPVYGGTLSIAYVAFATHIDVTSVDVSTLNEVAQYFYETLFTRDSRGRIAPLLVKDRQLSPNGLVVTWTLRPGIRFHDGSPFDAEAVKWNLERKIGKKQPLYDVLPITAIEAVNDATVRLTLSRPALSLEAFLTLPDFAMYSPTFVKRVGDDEMKRQASGTGPFMVADFRPNEVLRLKKNPSYWQKTLPYLDEVVFKVVPDINARAAALLAGDVDMAEALSFPDLRRIKNTAGFQAIEQMGSQQYYITINTRRPALRDIRVRQALNYAVDKQGIIRTVMLGNGTPATAVYINPTVDGYARAGTYEYDPARARQLLDEAGWKAGPGGVRQKDGTPLRLELITRKGAVPGDFESAVLIHGMLSAAGVECRLSVIESATFISRVTKTPDQADYDLVNFSVNVFPGDAEFIMRTFYATDSFAPKYFNRSYYSNSAVDRWIDESGRAVDRPARDRLYAQAIRQVFNDAPVIMLFDVPQTAAMRNSVAGVYLAGPLNEWFGKYAWKRGG